MDDASSVTESPGRSSGSPSLLPMVNGLTAMKTIGGPSRPLLASADEIGWVSFEDCGSATPRQPIPMTKLIPIHNSACCPCIVVSIAHVSSCTTRADYRYFEMLPSL